MQLVIPSLEAGPEVSRNLDTAGNQYGGPLAGHADGSFVVVWLSAWRYSQSWFHRERWDVTSRRYAAAGHLRARCPVQPPGHVPRCTGHEGHGGMTTYQRTAFRANVLDSSNVRLASAKGSTLSGHLAWKQ